jgi:hypothetical protein
MSEIPLTPQQIQTDESRASKEGYIHRTLVGLDQFVNVIAGGNPDETISSRSERAAKRGDFVGKAMCWWLDKLQKNHGEQAEAGDLERSTNVQNIEDNALNVPTSKV